MIRCKQQELTVNLTSHWSHGVTHSNALLTNETNPSRKDSNATFPTSTPLSIA